MMKLREIFEEYKNQRFKFIELGGNLGDHMIWAGAKKLADQIGLRYRTTSRWRPVVKKNEVIYVHGSGGFTSSLWAAAKVLRIVRAKYPRNLLIVGPSTTSLEHEHLKRVLPRDSERIIFFAREMTTYEFIKNQFYSRTYHDHDTALLLTKEDRFFRKFRGNIPIENKYSLLALRQDLESVPLPKKLRARKYDVICDPIIWCRSSSRFPRVDSFLGITKRKWISLHLKASKITTNRCHSAILGVLTGNNVEMFQNSYHKNRSVWEYSLRDKGVKWVGE